MSESQNPYQSQVKSAAPSSGAKAPTAFMVIVIICLCLGVLGMIGGCFGMGAAIFQEQIQAVAPPSNEFEAKVAEAQKEMMVPNLIAVGLNFVLATMMAIGGTGALMVKGWGRSLLRASLLASIAFGFIGLGIGIYSQMKMMSVFEDMPMGQNVQGAEMAQSIAQGAAVVGIVVGVVWTLVMMGFYLWSWLYLGNDKVSDYFAKAAK